MRLPACLFVWLADHAYRYRREIIVQLRFEEEILNAKYCQLTRPTNRHI